MIEKATIEFLKKLSKNNNRDWFNTNKQLYTAAYQNVMDTTDEILAGLIKFDKRMAGTDAKSCMFRIYRDTRFSKDKTPYKTNFGSAMGPGGRKSTLPGYYFHLKPGDSWLIGGLYGADNNTLAKIRQEIDYNLKEFEKTFKSKALNDLCGGLHEMDNKLKRPPKGYDADNPAVEYLKHKNFLLVHKVNDKTILGKDFVKYALKVYKTMNPFIVFLNRALE